MTDIFFVKVIIEIATLVKKEKKNQVAGKSIVSVWVLIPLANHNPAISSVPLGTENLNMFPQVDKKP